LQSPTIAINPGVARKIARFFSHPFALAFPKTVHEDRAFPPGLILIFLILISFGFFVSAI
jgi:hypothetical protein